MRTLRFGFAALALMLALPAMGQHSDVSPRVSGGRIVTGGHDDGLGVDTPDLRVFGFDFGEEADDPYFIGDPGFNAIAGSGLPSGSTLHFNVLGGGAAGLAANLTYWGGSGPVGFGATPAGEALQLILGAQSVRAGAGTNTLTGFPLGTVSATGTIHRHLGSALLGADGNSTAGDGVEAAAGIYLLALELASSDAGVQGSPPFWIVYNNGVGEAAHDAAIEYVETQFVPEPGGIGAIVVGLAVVLSRRGGNTFARGRV